MKSPHKEPNQFYARKYHRYALSPVRDHLAERPKKWERIKKMLIHVGLFVVGLVMGTIAGLVVLSLLEKWLLNGS